MLSKAECENAAQVGLPVANILLVKITEPLWTWTHREVMYQELMLRLRAGSADPSGSL